VWREFRYRVSGSAWYAYHPAYVPFAFPRYFNIMRLLYTALLYYHPYCEYIDAHPILDVAVPNEAHIRRRKMGTHELQRCGLAHKQRSIGRRIKESLPGLRSTTKYRVVNRSKHSVQYTAFSHSLQPLKRTSVLGGAVSLSALFQNVGLNGVVNSTTDLERTSVVLSQDTVCGGGYREFSIKGVDSFHLHITRAGRLVMQELIPSAYKETTILPGFNEASRAVSVNIMMYSNHRSFTGERSTARKCGTFRTPFAVC
jgi:hypothetical protein